MTDRKPPTELHAAAAQWLFSVGKDGQPLLGVTAMPATGDSAMHDVIYKCASAMIAATEALQMREIADQVARARMEERVALLRNPAQESQLVMVLLDQAFEHTNYLQIARAPSGRFIVQNNAHGQTLREALADFVERRRRGNK